MDLQPVTSRINEFEGINPLLNSQLQRQDWKEFHQFHIADLHTLLKQALSGTGYVVRATPSLQVRDTDSLGRALPPRRLDPDLSIRDRTAARTPPGRLASGKLKDSTLEMQASEAMNVDPQDYLYALAIWQADQKVEAIPGEQGRPVAWIELLSPSNKPGGTHYAEYADKRWSVVRAGQTLVEIDYLHESRPMLDRLPRYRPDQAGQALQGATPYYVSVIDPRPAPQYPDGKAVVYPFGLDEKLPTVFIPLSEGSYGINFDLDPAYDLTVKNHYGEETDYTQLPERIDSYSAGDRETIAARQLTVMSADPGVLNDPRRTEPLPLAFAIVGASQKLDRVLSGLEDLAPPPGSAHDRGNEIE